jgi:hypothetical protein
MTKTPFCFSCVTIVTIVTSAKAEGGRQKAEGGKNSPPLEGCCDSSGVVHLSQETLQNHQKNHPCPSKGGELRRKHESGRRNSFSSLRRRWQTVVHGMSKCKVFCCRRMTEEVKTPQKGKKWKRGMMFYITFSVSLRLTPFPHRGKGIFTLSVTTVTIVTLSAFALSAFCFRATILAYFCVIMK